VHIEWLIATGQTVADLVSHTWCRRTSSQYGLHLVPVPEDVFALPSDVHSSPLRCPIRIHLSIDVDRFRRTNDTQLLDHIRADILHRFGFIDLDCDRHHSTTNGRQFVHLSGGMFVLMLCDANDDTDYLWSWNHMLTHRYRFSTQCPESFQDGMLADFRKYCAGGSDDRRLDDFLQSFVVDQQ